jgi:hypothetical protein
VYVRPYPGEGTRTQVSTDGGFQPMWAALRRTLYYNHPSGAGAAAVLRSRASQRIGRGAAGILEAIEAGDSSAARLLIGEPLTRGVEVRTRIVTEMAKSRRSQPNALAGKQR